MKEGKNIKCDNCETVFYRTRSQMYKTNFCSKKCYSNYAKNDPNHASWNKGLLRSEKTKRKISQAQNKRYSSGLGLHSFKGKKWTELSR